VRAGHFSIACLVPAAAWLVSAACTDAQLYAPNYQPNIADLTGVEGDLCTDDPASLAFPLKIVVVIDGGISNMLDDRKAALQALVQQYSGSNVSFDFILMGQMAQSLTQGFTNTPALIQQAVNSIGSNVSPLRDYEAAMLQATTDIESDALGTSPGVRSRTHYALDFVAQGAPTPSLVDIWCGANQLMPGSPDCTTQFDANFCPNQVPAPADCELVLYTTLVTELTSFLQTNGALDFIAHFYEVGSDPRAQTILSSMTLAAKGAFAQAPFGKLNLLDRALIDPHSHFDLRELVVWNANYILRRGVPSADSDGDGLTDDEETSIKTSPIKADTDGDGVGDKIEHVLQYPGSEFNPLVPGKFTECSALKQPFPDSDGDGLNDCEEAVEGTSAFLQDTDDDGLPDGLEALRGVYPLADDRLYDTDGDGMRNGLELQQGTDPNNNDSAAAVTYAYTLSVVSDDPDSGVSVVLDPNPEYPFPGVTIDTVAGSVGGTITLGVAPGPPLTLAVSDVGSPQLGSPVDVSASGVFTLLSPSGLATRVRVDAQVLSRVAASATTVQITLTPSYRSCHQVNVQNIRLVSTQALPKGSPGGHVGGGWNIINVYMGQALDGIATSPTVYRFDTIPFQFIPPDQKSPSSAFVTLQQDDLTTLITN
jgi:Bacterial TSP3 repeat